MFLLLAPDADRRPQVPPVLKEEVLADTEGREEQLRLSRPIGFVKPGVGQLERVVVLPHVQRLDPGAVSDRLTFPDFLLKAGDARFFRAPPGGKLLLQAVLIFRALPLLLLTLTDLAPQSALLLDARLVLLPQRNELVADDAQPADILLPFALLREKSGLLLLEQVQALLQTAPALSCGLPPALHLLQTALQLLQALSAGPAGLSLLPKPFLQPFFAPCGLRLIGGAGLLQP